MGHDAIGSKFDKLTFASIAHNLTKVDSQPTPHNGVMVFVTGLLKVCSALHASPCAFHANSYSFSRFFFQTDENEPLSFAQAFHLVHNPADGGYYIFNDFFRLLVHNF